MQNRINVNTYCNYCDDLVDSHTSVLCSVATCPHKSKRKSKAERDLDDFLSGDYVYSSCGTKGELADVNNTTIIL